MARRLRVKSAIVLFSVIGVGSVVGIVFGLSSGVDSPRLPGVPLWAVGLVGVVCAIGGIILVLRQGAREGNR